MEKQVGKSIVDEHLGCFGDFNPEDIICKKFCALRLRCAIDNDQNTRMELLEDLMAYEEMNIKMQ